MKKFIIVSLLFMSLLLAPVFAQAQSALTQKEVTQQLIILLTQLIAQLQQQIADILAQQSVQTNTIQQQTQTINQIQQNTQQTAQNTQQIVQNTMPVPVCSSNWSCGLWGSCSNFQQTRICTDYNNCGTTTGKPSETQACQDKSSIDIINPQNVFATLDNIVGKEYVAYDWDTINSTPGVADNERPVGFIFPNEINEVYLGIIIRDINGQQVGGATITVTATDGIQNKTLTTPPNGAGNIIQLKDPLGNVSEVVSFSPYHYQFKTVGKHTLTFSVNGMTKSITLNVK